MRERCVVLQVDMLKGKPDKLLYSSTIKSWLPPYENEHIDATQRNEIADRIGKFLTANGYTVEVR